MNTEWTDMELDAFWQAHCEGLPLPPRMSAKETALGQQLTIHDPPARAIWTRKPPTPGGRAWHKVVVVG